MKHGKILGRAEPCIQEGAHNRLAGVRRKRLRDLLVRGQSREQRIDTRGHGLPRVLRMGVSQGDGSRRIQEERNADHLRAYHHLFVFSCSPSLKDKYLSLCEFFEQRLVLKRV